MLNKRQALTRDLCVFLKRNVLLFIFLGAGFALPLVKQDLPATQAGGVVLLTSYVVVTWVGQCGLLALLATALGALPGWLINHRLTMLLGAGLCATLSAGILVLDALVFYYYHFHINVLLIRLTLEGVSQIGFAEWLIVGLGMVVIATIEFLFTRIHTKPYKTSFRFVTYVVTCLAFSYLFLIFSYANNIHQFAMQGRAFPLYFSFLRAWFPYPQELQRIGEERFTQLRYRNSPLHYPLKPLTCHKSKHPNIIFIVIDSLRLDVINPRVTPNIYRYAKTNLWFTNHYSGGNATEAGLFALFYGLPSTYATAARKQHRAPLIIKRMKNLGYDFGIFSSLPLHIPPLHQTIFEGIPFHIHNPGAHTLGDADRLATQQLKAFISQHHKHPFMGFVFLGSAAGYCLPQTFKKPFQPAIEHCLRLTRRNNTDPKPYFNRYLNAVHFLDKQTATIINAIRQSPLNNNTIVIITGDHGQEFNDNGLNYWEHASNFTPIQVQTPLIIHWPGMTRRRVTHLTSHYDLAPTLLNDALTCSAEASDVSIGDDLFTKRNRYPLLFNSYVNFAIATEQQTVILYPDGFMAVQDNQARARALAPDTMASVKKGLHLLQRFYH